MVFSSIPFLFFFFPLFLLVYYLVPFKIKNFIIMVFSLIFYAWGEPVYVILMIISSLVGYISGLLIEKNTLKKKKITIMVIALILNFGALGFFKYGDFLINNINALLKTNIPLLEVGLPIGISFFTFQIVSYYIDVYRGDVAADHNFITFLAYVSMFPQLIAGPIVRYETIAKELKSRTIDFSNFSNGLIRFLEGLFKKVLLANTVGFIWTQISGDISSLSVLTAWLGIIAYSFQIYFDFSGYSDMAIGMGQMLGFHYLENFDYPYISKSITEFWRRWHISLSSWFRDYVYIPLGGSRCKKIINIRNILIVWTLTGIWHGANWNFILWGLYFGILLILEKFLLKNFLEKLPTFFKHFYALFFIIIGWLLFAFDDLTLLKEYALTLFGLSGTYLFDQEFLFYISNYFILFVFCMLFSIPFGKKVKAVIQNSKHQMFYSIIMMIIYIIFFIITISLLVSETYNPFLYFRF